MLIVSEVFTHAFMYAQHHWLHHITLIFQGQTNIPLEVVSTSAQRVSVLAQQEQMELYIWFNVWICI